MGLIYYKLSFVKINNINFLLSFWSKLMYKDQLINEIRRQKDCFLNSIRQISSFFFFFLNIVSKILIG